MLKFLILVAIILWIDSFFGGFEALGKFSTTSINVLSFIIIVLIIVGFIS